MLASLTRTSLLGSFISNIEIGLKLRQTLS